MFRLFRVLPTGLLVCVLAACAGKTGERLDNLEARAHGQHILDLRLTHLEERVTHTESAIGEVREQVAAFSASAGRRRQAKPPTERLPASPVILGTVPTGILPPVESIGYLPFTDPQASEPLPPPAVGVGVAPVNDPFAGPGLTTVPLAPGKASKARPRPVSPKRSVSGPAVSGAGASAYNAAYAIYEKGEYTKARQAFADFLAASPQSPLAPNSLYWQGECQYSLGNYGDAILFFQEVVNRYPKHVKAAAALLKAGHSYERLKDMDNARFYWRILVDDFPASAPAALARKRLSG